MYPTRVLLILKPWMCGSQNSSISSTSPPPPLSSLTHYLNGLPIRDSPYCVTCFHSPLSSLLLLAIDFSSLVKACSVPPAPFPHSLPQLCCNCPMLLVLYKRSMALFPFSLPLPPPEPSNRTESQIIGLLFFFAEFVLLSVTLELGRRRYPPLLVTHGFHNLLFIGNPVFFPKAASAKVFFDADCLPSNCARFSPFRIDHGRFSPNMLALTDVAECSTSIPFSLSLVSRSLFLCGRTSHLPPPSLFFHRVLVKFPQELDFPTCALFPPVGRVSEEVYWLITPSLSE